jgi:hypothetical protein
MNDTIRRPSLPRVLLALGLLLAGTLATVVLSPRTGATESQVLAAAGVAALATLAMAALFARLTAYPLAAWWTTAGLMAAGIVAGALWAPSPAYWWEHSRGIVWMYPWFFMIFAPLGRGARGICSPASRFSGWLLVGTGLLFSLLLQGAALLGSRF